MQRGCEGGGGSQLVAVSGFSLSGGALQVAAVILVIVPAEMTPNARPSCRMRRL